MSYYTYDTHGSVVSMNGQGYAYDAFGNILENGVTGYNPFRYNGEYCDDETGMIYLRARYYDPSLGRFITEDPAKDGLNWYVFCSNNPVRLVDSTGTVAEMNEKDFKRVETYTQNMFGKEASLVYEVSDGIYSVTDVKYDGKVNSETGSALLKLIFQDEIIHKIEFKEGDRNSISSGKYGEKEQSVLIFSHRKGEKLDDAELMSTLIHELTHSYTRVNGFNKAVMDACRAYIDENGVYHFPNRQEIERAYAEAAAITVERIFRAEMGFRDRDELEGRITIREHQAQDAIYVKNSTGEIKPIDDTGYGYGYWPWIVNKNPESCHYKTFQFVAIPNYMGIGIANGIREQAGM